MLWKSRKYLKCEVSYEGVMAMSGASGKYLSDTGDADTGQISQHFINERVL